MEVFERGEPLSINDYLLYACKMAEEALKTREEYYTLTLAVLRHAIKKAEKLKNESS